MKLVTYSRNGQVSLGARLGEQIVDLPRADGAAVENGRQSGHSAAANGFVPPDLLALLRGGEGAMSAAQRAVTFVEERQRVGPAADFCCPLTEAELLAPIPRPGKIVCVGLNYHSHLAEIGESAPEYPILFHKPATSVIGHGEAIRLPRVSRQVDYEGELAVIVGRRGKYIPERDALSYVAGYTCANDVSAHDIEFRTSQWASGKMLDTFCPLGPVLATRDEIPDPNQLRLKTILNGRTVQDTCTSDMHFPVPFLISYISSLATLEPGDVILTGTPAGLGCNRRPQVFLQPGDEISVAIDGIGILTNHAVAEAGCEADA